MSKDISDLMIAFREWNEAEHELRKCYREVEYSPGYHCFRYAEREEKARNTVGEILNQIIDERVEAKLNVR